jgi:hypothetical protein
MLTLYILSTTGQQDALFTFSVIRLIASKCFEHLFALTLLATAETMCTKIYQLVYVQYLLMNSKQVFHTCQGY